MTQKHSSQEVLPETARHFLGAWSDYRFFQKCKIASVHIAEQRAECRNRLKTLRYRLALSEVQP